MSDGVGRGVAQVSVRTASWRRTVLDELVLEAYGMEVSWFGIGSGHVVRRL